MSFRVNLFMYSLEETSRPNESSKTFQGRLETQSLIWGDLERPCSTPQNSRWTPSNSSRPSMKKQNLVMSFSRLAILCRILRSSGRCHASWLSCLIVFGHRSVHVDSMRSGSCRKISYSNVCRRPCQDFCMGVPALQKKCLAMTTGLEEDQIDNAWRVCGWSVTNFMSVDLPEPGLPETQKKPSPFRSHPSRLPVLDSSR